MATSTSPPHKNSRILIIGSGVFGLSTALHLARAGYTHLTVLDMQDTHTAAYDPDQGIDSASADWNKIVRFSYGDEIHYQRLAFEAAGLWEGWNAGIAREGWGGGVGVWVKSGMLRVSAQEGLGEFEEATLRGMEAEGLRGSQFVVGHAEDERRARERGWAGKLDPTERRRRLGHHCAVLDATAGWVRAFRACAWAQELCRREGVGFVLGRGKGEVVRIEEDGARDGRPLVRTKDGKAHEADLVIVAGGGWTPGLLPEVSGLLEATAGSVATVQIPRERRNLWAKYAPERFPVFCWGTHQGKDIYNFPRDEHGAVKIGYRATK